MVGANLVFRHVETQFKLISWLYASLVAGDVILKYALGVPNLTGWWSIFCIIASVTSGLALFFYLRAGIRRRDPNETALLTVVLVASLILDLVYAGIVVF